MASLTHKYIPRTEQTEENLFIEEYYSSTDTKIYIDDVEQTEIGYISYSVQEQLKPIYGYASNTFDDVAVGNRIVVGSLKVPIKNPEIQSNEKDIKLRSKNSFYGAKPEQEFNFDFNEKERKKIEETEWVGDTEKKPKSKSLTDKTKELIDKTKKAFKDISLGDIRKEVYKTNKLKVSKYARIYDDKGCKTEPGSVKENIAECRIRKVYENGVIEIDYNGSVKYIKVSEKNFKNIGKEGKTRVGTDSINVQLKAINKKIDDTYKKITNIKTIIKN